MDEITYGSYTKFPLCRHGHTLAKALSCALLVSHAGQVEVDSWGGAFTVLVCLLGYAASQYEMGRSGSQMETEEMREGSGFSARTTTQHQKMTIRFTKEKRKKKKT